MFPQPFTVPPELNIDKHHNPLVCLRKTIVTHTTTATIHSNQNKQLGEVKDPIFMRTEKLERNKLYTKQTTSQICGVPVTNTIQYLTPPHWHITPYQYHQLLVKAAEEQRKNTKDTQQINRYNKYHQKLDWIKFVFAPLGVITSGIVGATIDNSTTETITAFIFLAVAISCAVIWGLEAVAPTRPYKNYANTPTQKRIRELHKQGGLLLPVSLLDAKTQNRYRIHENINHYHDAYQQASMIWANPNDGQIIENVRRKILANPHNTSVEWDSLMRQHRDHRALDERISHSDNIIVEDDVKTFKELFMEASIIFDDINKSNRVIVSEQEYLRAKNIIQTLNQLSRKLNQHH